MAAGTKRDGIPWRVLLIRSLVVTATLFVTTVALASWWLTAPLEDTAPTVADVGPPVPLPAGVVPPPPGEAPKGPVWPEGRLDGQPAKVILLEALVAAAERLNAVESYTATFHKQERIDGKLGPRQTLAMKARHRPFAIYLRFLAPTEGREVVYAEGRHDNKVIAHSGGVARVLVPRLALPPTHPLALAGSRHAVTEAGLANLTTRLIHFRKLDLVDPEAVTVLDRVTDDSGKTWLRSVHTHPTVGDSRPFARVEVLYDPTTFLPMDIQSYDWPRPGQAGGLLLAEHYTYEDVKLDADLNALDFDPANPAYSFHRY